MSETYEAFTEQLAHAIAHRFERPIRFADPLLTSIRDRLTEAHQEGRRAALREVLALMHDPTIPRGLAQEPRGFDLLERVAQMLAPLTGDTEPWATEKAAAERDGFAGLPNAQQPWAGDPQNAPKTASLDRAEVIRRARAYQWPGLPEPLIRDLLALVEEQEQEKA